MPETRIATQAVLDSRRDGSTRNPKKQMTGSARNPLNRSRATAAKAVSLEPMCFAERLIRSTSPPIVEGSTFPTNWPAK